MPNNSPIYRAKPKRKGKHGRRFLRVFLVISILIIALHITLPWILLTVANKKMKNMPDYIGHLDGLQMNMFAGSMTFIGFSLQKKGGKIPVPFMDIQKTKVTIDWKALFKGKLVSVVAVDDFVVNFVKGPTKATSQSKLDKSWMDFADKILPLDINRLKLNNGEVHYMDYHSSPKIDLLLNKIFVVGENLSTVRDTSKILPANVKLTANAYGGTLAANLNLAPLEKIPTFDINAELKSLPLTYLNNFLKAYAKIDVQKGWFSVYMEAAAKDGLIKGYAKPFINDLDVINDKERKGMPFKEQVIESLVEVAAWIFKDKKYDRLATNIKFEGSLMKPDISIWGIIGEALINAFVGSLIPSLENSINIEAIGTKNDKNFLEKIFDPDKKKKDKHKKKKKKTAKNK